MFDVSRQLLTLALSMLCVVVLSGCATVNIDQDRHAAFAPIQSFAFLPDNDPDSLTGIDDARIERALIRELAARDIQLVAPDEADIWVRYDIVEEIRNQSTGFSYGFGAGRNNIGLALLSPPDSRQVKEGKLVVELVTPSERRAVWRANGRRNITESMGSERREQLIDRLIADMVAGFPGQS